MKKVILMLAILMASHTLNAQWQLNGNLVNSTNWIGSTNPQPFKIGTDNVFRSKINPNVTYTVNGYSMPHNGHMLVGIDNNSISTGNSIYSNLGAYSLLHLNGTGSQFQEYGYRPWMETGMTLTGNKDLSYLGLRKLSTDTAEEDITETVLLWSDNSSTSEGPDRLVFRFSGYGGSDGATVSSDQEDGETVD